VGVSAPLALQYLPFAGVFGLLSSESSPAKSVHNWGFTSGRVNNSSAVVVRLIGSNNQILEVFSEDFRPVPNTDLMQSFSGCRTIFPLDNAP